MSISSVALKYVNALTDVADLAELKSVENGLSAFSKAYQSSSELRLSIQNPAIALADRIALVAAVAERSSSSEKLSNLLMILVQNDRVELADQILETLRIRILELEKSRSVTVVSAREVPQGERGEFERSLSKQLGGACQVAWKVNSALIGGVQVKLGDSLLDRSVAGAIERAERELLAF